MSVMNGQFHWLRALPTLVFDTAVTRSPASIGAWIIRQYGCPDGLLGRLLGHVMSFEHVPVTDWTLELMRVRHHDRVLDVGCGAGMAIARLAQLAPGGTVAGIDCSATMVEQAITRNRALVQSGQADIRQGDVASLPFDTGSFDKVCAIETLYFWPEPLAGLREIHRVLAPGGRATITLEYSGDALQGSHTADCAARAGASFYTASDLMDMLRTAGFDRVRYETAPARAHGWVYAEGVKAAGTRCRGSSAGG